MCCFLELAECCDHSSAQLAVAEQQQEQPEVLVSQTAQCQPQGKPVLSWEPPTPKAVPVPSGI